MPQSKRVVPAFLVAMPLAARSIPMLLILGLVIPCALLAQTPIVTAVLNEASGDARLSPGLRAVVRYAPSTLSDTSPVFNNQTVTVKVGGLLAHLDGVEQLTPGEGSAHVLLPRELPAGPTTLTITTSGGASAPFNITLDSYSPGLFNNLGRYCAWSQPDGIVQLSAVGLGATSPVVPTRDEHGLQGPVVTMAKPAVSVGGRAAEVSATELALLTYGIYTVRIKLPTGVPDGLQAVVLTVGGKTSNSVNLLVGTANALATGGDLSLAAPEAIVTAYGCSGPLAASTLTGDGQKPPTSLGGTTVKVKDSSGVERLALLRLSAAGELRCPAGHGQRQRPGDHHVSHWGCLYGAARGSDRKAGRFLSVRKSVALAPSGASCAHPGWCADP